MATFFPFVALNASDPAAPDGAVNVHFRKGTGSGNSQEDPAYVSAHLVRSELDLDSVAYGADIRPDSPAALDEEFDGPSLDGKWSVLNSPDEHGFSTRFPSRYYFGARVGDARWSGIGQTAPSGSFAVECAVSLGWRRHSNASERFVGLWVEQGDGVLEAFALKFSSSAFGFRHETWNSYSSFGSERAITTFHANKAYLRVDIDAETPTSVWFSAYYSQDGMAWVHHSNRGLGNVTIAKIAIGARHNNSNADDNARSLFYADWFRRAAEPIFIDTPQTSDPAEY